MSSVEFEAPGFWSCLYCEGTWIPGAEVAALSSKAAQAPAASDWTSVSGSQSASTRSLICPDCGSQSFAHISAQDVVAHCCRNCHGIYLPKGALEAFQAKPIGTSAPQDAASAIALGVANVIACIAVGAFF